MTVPGGTRRLSIGLLGEYVGKIYFETKQRPVYLIRDVILRSCEIAAPSPEDEKRTHDAV